LSPIHPLTLYGIANCSTVKKALAWLQERNMLVVFHNFKKDGLPAERLPVWLDALGWELVLNRRGTTWRGLDAAVQASVTDAASAAALIAQYPSLIKRPLVEWSDGSITVGFDEATWNQRLTTGSQ